MHIYTNSIKNFIRLLYMTEIDLSIYKREEEKNKLNEQKRKKIQTMRMNEDIKPKKTNDDMMFQYAKKFRVKDTTAQDIGRQIKLEKEYRNFQRDQAIKDLIAEKKKQKLLQSERDKFKSSAEIGEIKKGVITTLSYPYKQDTIKRQIFENEMIQSEYLEQVMTDKIVNTCFSYNPLILPLIVASKYMETEKKYNLLLTQLQLQKQAQNKQQQQTQPVVQTKTEEETIDDKKEKEQKEEEE